MTEEQYETFLYCCRKMASKIHFNNEDGIVQFLGNKSLDEQTFHEVIAKNARLLKALNSGVCFTMSSWVFELLRSQGLDTDYYFMESVNSKWYNAVILYLSPEGYKICDLAAQTKANEAIMEELIEISVMQSKNPANDYSIKVGELIKALAGTKYLNMEIEDYIKEYPLSLCRVLMHHGYEEAIYTKVPRKNLLDFIKEQVEKRQSISTKNK